MKCPICKKENQVKVNIDDQTCVFCGSLLSAPEPPPPEVQASQPEANQPGPEASEGQPETGDIEPDGPGIELDSIPETPQPAKGYKEDPGLKRKKKLGIF